MHLEQAQPLHVRDLPNLNARAFAALAGPGGGKTTLLREFVLLPGLACLAIDPVGELADRLETEPAVHVVRVPNDWQTRRVRLPNVQERAWPTLVQWVTSQLLAGAKVVLDVKDVWGSLVPVADAFVASAERARVRDLILICEEAQEYIPQDAAVSEAVRRAFSLGRNWRWGRVCASQRAAEVNKKMLERCDTRFLGRIEGARDALAVDDLLKLNIPDARERNAALRLMRDLPAGHFILREPAVPPGVNK